MGKGVRKRQQRAKAQHGASLKRRTAVCILPDFLYLGGVSATANPTFLNSHGITHILSIGQSPAVQFGNDDISMTTTASSDPTLPRITYHRLALKDLESADIKPCVDKACDILDSVAEGGGKILVHCQAGISRSPTIVAAYLMKCRGYTLNNSLKTLVQARDAVAPNPGFLTQLREMEAELFNGVVSFPTKDGDGDYKAMLSTGNIWLASFFPAVEY